MRNWGLAAFAALVLTGFALPSDSLPSPSIPWETNLDAAQKRAAKENKPLFLDFSAQWCTPCQKMLATTYKDKKVVAKMKQFIPVLLDYDQSRPTVKKYGVDSLPTFLFFAPNGKEIKRITKFQSPKALLQQMQSSLKKAAAKS